MDLLDTVPEDREIKLREVASNLQLAISSLDEVHAQSAGICHSVGSVEMADVISYAHRLSFTTFAPFGFTLGMPMRAYSAPAPQEQHFRTSILHEYAAKCAEKKAELDRKEAARARAELERKRMRTPHPPENAKVPKMPAGVFIPPMPAGWKPGQKISLPVVQVKTNGTQPPPAASSTSGIPDRARPANNTHDASGASKAVSNAAPNPVPVSLPDPAPQRPAKPSTRAVQFVQLDLNPDLGDELGEFVSESSGSDDDSDDE
mmetsp:Transcript_1339/g.2775  ORF Transcript_1339/g.2775 Transcript_1339/m.2775 type:complete len:261 (-) Transcript_1339:183-965(-)|eukprot:CAMPEP_0114234558 /NCGR_PEP_ID=MMETSP0058-20121206/5772_1 /TAXON_ID=36894 /ORGANISM="Pyramimonas parkeae, CCMP726" /LENGTH=260 /DNA_ID=CAMNT_0001346243 /DNA_START=176 /DNA_END=958 /DNA_ORIENTATION=-